MVEQVPLLLVEEVVRVDAAAVAQILDELHLVHAALARQCDRKLLKIYEALESCTKAALIVASYVALSIAQLV